MVCFVRRSETQRSSHEWSGYFPAVLLGRLPNFRNGQYDIRKPITEEQHANLSHPWNGTVAVGAVRAFRRKIVRKKQKFANKYLKRLYFSKCGSGVPRSSRGGGTISANELGRQWRTFPATTLTRPERRIASLDAGQRVGLCEGGPSPGLHAHEVRAHPQQRHVIIR